MFNLLKKTTVLIGQNDQFQGHEHTIIGCWDNGTQPGQPTYSRPTYQYSSNTSAVVSDTTNGTPRVGNETRGKNLTVRYWKRIS